MSASCRRIREWLTRFLDDELPDRDRVAVEAHLRGCGACREEVEAVRDLRASWRQAPGLPSTPEDRAAIVAAAGPILASARQAARAAAPGGRRLGPWWARFPIAPTAADLVTAGALGVSIVLLVVLHGRAGRGFEFRPRSGPVLTAAELAAREEGRAIENTGSFRLTDPIPWRGDDSPQRRLQ